MFANVTKIIISSLSTGSCSYSVNREARMLWKLMKSDKSKKMRHEKNSVVPRESYSFMREDDYCTKRMSILNKTFMTHITSIISSGKNSTQLLGRGIEISKVKISKDYKHVKVYWMAPNEDLKNDDIGIILKNTAGELRHEISSLRFMGSCPEIIFVRDVTAEKSFEVIRLLNTLDVGPAPVSESSDVDNLDQEQLEMRQDIFSLKHDNITGRIIGEMIKKKSNEIEESKNKSKDNPEKNITNVGSDNFIPFDKHLFAKFYKKRLILQQKMDKNFSHGMPRNEDTNTYDNEFFDFDMEEFQNDMDEFRNDDSIERDER